MLDMRRLAIRRPTLFLRLWFTLRQHYFFGFFLCRLLRVLWRRRGSNPQHPACKAGALPIELRPRINPPPAHAGGSPSLGAHGLEPWTSALSGLRSSQLSYAPLVKQKSQTMIGLALSASNWIERQSVVIIAFRWSMVFTSLWGLLAD
jgi:hypothetical protein